MTALIDAARKALGKGTELDRRVAGLQEAVSASRGRLPDGVVDAADKVVQRANGRLKLSSQHTVVALAGATGSGKSSTFNALTGLDLAAVGVRRPTTSWATACIWGQGGAEELLAWLGIPARHQVIRDSMLDNGHRSRTNAELDGLVLLDLPDHDSTELGHHLEVDRLIELADLMVWVLDPQKYADAAVHDRFLRPMAQHRDVVMVVLNHIDEVLPDRREGLLSDVRRLLDADGLQGIPVLAVSAVTGDGIDELRALINKRVADKAANRTRLATDVRSAAESLRAVSGQAAVPTLDGRSHEQLVDAVSDAAGVPLVVDAVDRSTRIRAGRATGWPVTSWLSKLRPDPLKRLHLDLGKSEKDLISAARSSLPAATQVQKASVESAVRDVADAVSVDLTRPWATAVRRASVDRSTDLTDGLDRSIGRVDLGVAGLPWWCSAVRLIQWVLLLGMVGGALWLGALLGLGYLQMPAPSTPKLHGIPVPTVLLIGGLVLGVLLGLLCRVLVGLTARSRARKASRALRAAVAEVAHEMVIKPVQVELSAYAQAREGLDRALG